MNDKREKLIKWLERCMPGTPARCMECPYEKDCCVKGMVTVPVTALEDALDYLKWLESCEVKILPAPHVRASDIEACISGEKRKNALDQQPSLTIDEVERMANDLAWCGAQFGFSVKKQEENKARLLTLEEAQTATGHGWEEIWFSGDAEMEECQMIFECVFIGGHIRGADGDVGEVEEDTYNKPYHSRLWMGEEAPTAEQRKAVKWDD